MPFFVTYPTTVSSPTYCIFLFILYTPLISALISLLPSQLFSFVLIFLYFMWIIIAVLPLLQSPSYLEKYSILESLVMGLCLSVHYIFWICAPKTQGVWLRKLGLPFLHNNDHSIMLQLFLRVLAYISSIFLPHFVWKKTSRRWKHAQVTWMVTDKMGHKPRKKKAWGSVKLSSSIWRTDLRGKRLVLICVLRGIRIKTWTDFNVTIKATQSKLAQYEMTSLRTVVLLGVFSDCRASTWQGHHRCGSYVGLDDICDSFNSELTWFLCFNLFKRDLR